MRVLVVQESDYGGRGPHQQHHLLERLQSRGHVVRVIDYDIDWSKNNHIDFLGRRKRYVSKGKSLKDQRTEVIRPGILRAPILCYLSTGVTHVVEIIRQIESFSPHVVIGMGILNTFLGCLLSRFYGVRFVLYLIDSLHTLVPEPYLRPLAQLLEKQSIRHSDRVIVINRSLRDYVRRLVPSTSPLVISAGVEKGRFGPAADRNGVRRRLGYSQADFVLFFMGWLYDFTGLREVSQYLLDCQSEGLRLLVLGKGDLYRSLTDMALSSECGGRIKVIPWVPYEDVPSYVAASDVCILPAHLNDVMMNIVPIKVYEYLASGKPVITTRLPGILHEFGHSSGIIYATSPTDVVNLAMKLKTDESLYRRLADAATECTARLDWDSVTSRFEDTLLKLAHA